MTIVTIIFFTTSTIWRITDVWKYTALVKPEIYLVKKTVDLVEKKLEAPPAQHNKVDKRHE